MNEIWLPPKDRKNGVLEKFDLDNPDDVRKLNDAAFLADRAVELNPKVLTRLKNAVVQHSLVSKISGIASIEPK